MTGRAATWVAYGVILTGATAFAGLPEMSSSSAGPVLRFERSKSSGTSLSLAEQHSLEMRSLVLEVGDQEPVQSLSKLHVWSGSLAVVVDEIDPVTGLLCRRYDSAKGLIQTGQIDEMDQEFRGPEMPLVSPLADVGVAFTPKEDAPGGYARHYDSAKTLIEPLLPRLAPPRDWGALLPPAGPSGEPTTVELGEEWDVVPAALICAISPTGDLMFAGDETADPRMLRSVLNGLGGNLHLGFDGKVDGSAKARFTKQGVSPEDGAYADIKIEFSISLSANRSKFDAENRADSIEGPDTEILAVDLEQTFTGIIELRWSLDSNGPISCTTDCDESVLMSLELVGDAGIPSRQTVLMEGDLIVGVAFEAVPLRRSARAE